MGCHEIPNMAFLEPERGLPQRCLFLKEKFSAPAGCSPSPISLVVSVGSPSCPRSQCSVSHGTCHCYVKCTQVWGPGLGPHSGAGDITYLSFSTFFLLFHHTVYTHRTRGWVFPVEKELGYRGHSFSPPVFIKRQPRLFSIGWHSYVFKPIADLFKGEPGF